MTVEDCCHISVHGFQLLNELPVFYWVVSGVLNVVDAAVEVVADELLFAEAEKARRVCFVI